MESPKKKTKNIPKPTFFGKNLKFLRRMQGLNQRELGEKLSLSRNNVASYESGLVEPNMNKFLEACDFFNIPPKQMLEEILSDRVSEVTQVEEQSTIDQYVSDQMEKFVTQTNEMTKVFEGYKTFFQMKRELNTKEENNEFHSILEDLLELLQSLITSNWNLIQSIYPIDNEEDDK